MIKNTTETFQKDGLKYIREIYTDTETGEIRAKVESLVQDKAITEPSQLDIIQEAVEKSNEELRQEGAAVATAAFKPFGASMTFALAAASLDVPPTAGAFAEEWEKWQADGEIAAAKSLWKYNGIGYQARTEVQKIEAYAPDQAVNNYAVRPIPDSGGIFPTVLNMDVEIGMKLLDGEDGKVYECYANPITSLQWQPHEMPASFRLLE